MKDLPNQPQVSVIHVRQDGAYTADIRGEWNNPDGTYGRTKYSLPKEVGTDHYIFLDNYYENPTEPFDDHPIQRGATLRIEVHASGGKTKHKDGECVFEPQSNDQVYFRTHGTVDDVKIDAPLYGPIKD